MAQKSAMSVLLKTMEANQKELFSTRNGKHLVFGKTPDNSSIMLQSNDYLCLENHPKIVNAQIEALKATEETTCDKSQLEKRFAQWLGFESAFLTQSGWAANVGLLEVICKTNMPVYIDQFAHNSLHYGIKVAQGNRLVFKHNDMDSLQKIILENGPGIIIVDSVYSAFGTLCPLKELVQIGHENGCLVWVDESHSFGTFWNRWPRIRAPLEFGRSS